MAQQTQPNNLTVDAKVDETLSSMAPGQKEEILQNFNSFKMYLGKRIQMAEMLGLNEEQLAKAAERVAGYLAAHEEPRNREEKLLQELWIAGTQEERHKLAHLLVKLAQSAR